MKPLLHLSLAVLAIGAALAAPPEYDIVFFDLPEYLEPSPIPAPTVALAALPDHPADINQLSLAGVVYKPDPLVHGNGPYPTIIILHGSGGLWSNDIIANGPASQFEDWAETLCNLGYLCIFPDSFNPRGIPGNFQSRRPHYDSNINDALCSPNYERPKDVVATLSYLDSRSDVDRNAIGILAFSHGAQTGLNALLDTSIDLSPYTVRYVDLVENPEYDVDDEPPTPEFIEETINLEVPDPIRIPSDLPFPKVFACYYPGCGHFNYHGSPNSVTSNRYMPDRRCDVIMFHGTEDSLLGVDDAQATPLTGNLYPIKFVESSALHATDEGIDNPFVHHIIFDQAEHSFDNEDIENVEDWNSPEESIDEKAKRLARDETLKWFAFRLKPAQLAIRTDQNDDTLLEILWHGESGINYQIRKSSLLSMDWADEGNPTVGSNNELNYSFDPDDSVRAFYQLQYTPTTPPSAEPENSGFFLPYSSFDY